jgi:hypothetical protein
VGVRGGDGEAFRCEAGFFLQPLWPSSIANALAQIFWVTPSDSARRKPKPLNRTGNSGVTSTAAAPMRHSLGASAGNNDPMDSAAIINSDFMNSIRAGGQYGYRSALGQAEITWQAPILRLTAI